MIISVTSWGHGLKQRTNSPHWDVKLTLAAVLAAGEGFEIVIVLVLSLSLSSLSLSLSVSVSLSLSVCLSLSLSVWPPTRRATQNTGSFILYFGSTDPRMVVAKDR